MPDDLATHWVARKQELQGEGDLATRLVSKVDALSRASIDLAIMRKEASIYKATEECALFDKNGDAALQEKMAELNQIAEEQIRQTQEYLAKIKKELQDNLSEQKERKRKNCQAQITQIEKEYADFVASVTTNCAAYVEKIMQMDHERLSLALREFNTEVSKWLLPEDK